MANSDDGADTITFAPALGGQTITLVSGDLDVTDSVTITGLGADKLAVAGNGSERVFTVGNALDNVTISGLTVTGGKAAGNGGGLFVGSNTALTLTNVWLKDNQAAAGGGLFLDNAALAMTGSAVSGNQADDAGGIAVVGGSAAVSNSTIAGNKADNGGGLAATGSLTLTNVTVTGNTASTGGGLFVQTGSATLLNTIVANNTAATDADVNGANLVTANGVLTAGAVTFAGGSGSTQANIPAQSALQFGPLQNNGGTTPTVALLAGSPAIDAGLTSGAPATDQRGVARSGTAADLGAFEFQADGTSFPTGTTGKAPPPSQNPILVGGGGSGTAVQFTAAGANGTVTFPNLSGVIHTAVADVDGKGKADFIGATAAGVPGRVVVVSGEDGSVLADFFPFGQGYTGGVNVAAAAFGGGSDADLAVSPDTAGVGAVVLVFDGKGLTGGITNPSPVARFFALADLSSRADQSPANSARLGVGDVNGDGTPDLLVAAGTGGGPRVTVWNGAGFAGAGGGQPTLNPLTNLFVFEPSQTGGAYVTAGDVSGDGFDDLIFGGGPGGGNRVRIVNGAQLFSLTADQLGAVDLDSPTNLASGLVRNNFSFGDPNARGGIRLTTRDADGDSFTDLIIGSGENQPSQLTLFSGASLQAVAGQTATPAGAETDDPFSQTLPGGVFVG